MLNRHFVCMLAVECDLVDFLLPGIDTFSPPPCFFISGPECMSTPGLTPQHKHATWIKKASSKKRQQRCCAQKRKQRCFQKSTAAVCVRNVAGWDVAER